MAHMTCRLLKLSLPFCVAALVSVAASAVAQNVPEQRPSMQIANPASENCIRHGGTLSILKRGDGGEYGVCIFADNRQCEEWAMFRGDCPVGGVDVSGYGTEAARYCVITGGRYQPTGSGTGREEEGTCSFRNGRSCDAWDYFSGSCGPDAPSGKSSYNDPFPYCAAVGTIDAADHRYKGAAMPDSLVQAMIRQGIVPADAPPGFQRNAVWRCMDSRVLVCHFGANIPCLEKADRSRKPAAAMRDFCRENPSADAIPAAVTGRATMYEWSCRGGKPKVVRQLLRVDPQGYLSDFWHELTP